MSEMAYGNNAVQLTLQAYLSKNVENENTNKNENKNENRNENENKNEIVENGENTLINEKIIEKKSEIKGDDCQETDIENTEISMLNKRQAAYNTWLDVPHTPYRRVRKKTKLEIERKAKIKVEVTVEVKKSVY